MSGAGDPSVGREVEWDAGEEPSQEINDIIAEWHRSADTGSNRP